MNALLLIDIQNDFIPGGALAVDAGNEIITVVNKLQAHFNLVVATQDWHPANHKSFAAQHLDKNVFDIIDLNGLQQKLWPNHCVQGTAGANFSSELNMDKVAAIFRKGMDEQIDSYSGFYDNGHKKSTGLAAYLKGKNVTTVYLAGLAADYCVYYTAKDSLAEGFKTMVIEDATRAINKKGFEDAKHQIERKGGQIIDSKSIV